MTKEKTPEPKGKTEMRPLPEMAGRLVDLEARVKALEEKTDRIR